MGTGQRSVIPAFASDEWRQAVREMVRAHAPRRFGVVAHDPMTENSAVLAWGFDYGDGEVIVESVRNDRRWTMAAAEDIRNHFPHAPNNGLEILWIDGPPTSPS